MVSRHSNIIVLTCSDRKPDGTLIPSHMQHIHSGKSKPGLGNKSNVLFNFVQVIYIEEYVTLCTKFIVH